MSRITFIALIDLFNQPRKNILMKYIYQIHFSKFQRVTYQCTYPGCRDQRASVRGIESHVRKEHLLKEDPERLLEEGEEEFYYTEVENPSPHSQQLQFFSPQQKPPFTSFTSHIQTNGFSFGSTKDKQQSIFAPSRARSYSSSDSTSSAKKMATLSLADHVDMARPAHEDPGRGAIVISTTLNSSVARAPRSILVPSSRHSSGGSNNNSSLLMRSPDPITMPITIAPSAVRFLNLKHISNIFSKSLTRNSFDSQ